MLKLIVYYVEMMYKFMHDDDGINLFAVNNWANFKYSKSYKDYANMIYEDLIKYKA